MRAFAISFAILFAATAAVADDPRAPETKTSEAKSVETKSVETKSEETKSSGAKSGDDFDLLPPEALPDPAAVAQQEEIERKLGLRRTMLEAHQIGGFVTLAGLAATAVVGQLNYADKYGGGGDTGKYIALHEGLAVGTSAVFAATGLLALFAPSPIDKPLRLDTATLHKTAMAIATAGMVAEIVLGVLTAAKESSGSNPDLSLTQRNLAIAHQVIGYTTLVATAAGFTVLVF